MFYFLPRLSTSNFYGPWRYHSPMAKTSNALNVVRTTRPHWADAETRAFLDRSGTSNAFAKTLHLILIIAMVVATTKIAMVLLFRV